MRFDFAALLLPRLMKRLFSLVSPQRFTSNEGETSLCSRCAHSILKDLITSQETYLPLHVSYLEETADNQILFLPKNVQQLVKKMEKRFDSFNVRHLPSSSLNTPSRRLTGSVWEPADTRRQVCAVSCNSMQVFLVSAAVLKMRPRLIQPRVSIYTMWGFPDLCRLASTLPGVIVPLEAVEKKKSSQVVQRHFWWSSS